MEISLSTENSDLLNSLKENQSLEVLIFNFIHSAYKNNFVNNFSKFAPEIATQILSFSLDQGCSCSKQIASYIDLYKNECAEFLYNFCVEKGALASLETLMNNQSDLINVKVDLSGKIAKTTIKEWGNFSEKIKYAIFRHFSVVEKGDDLLVFFL